MRAREAFHYMWVLNNESRNLPGVPAISTLNVRSMVLFSNGDPLWSLEDKKNDIAAFHFSSTEEEDESFMS